MRRLAIIPARGGSKRIPRKNIRPFCGKPIIAWSIEAALKSGLFDAVMTSTDDQEIAGIAKAAGATVPFLRADSTSNDHAGLLDVLAEVVTQYEVAGESFDEICCLLPTAPTVTADRLRQAYELFSGGRFDCVFPAVRFSYPVQRALWRRDDGATGMVDPSTYKVRSQDLEPRLHDAGQFYWVRIRPDWRTQPLLTGNVGSLVISELEAQDIDTEDDWAICEFKFGALRRTA